MDMRYMERVYVDAETMNTLEELLNQEGPSKEHGKDEVIHTSTATFLDGHEMDIKVCNSDFDAPYVDPVLFDDTGVEVNVDAVTDTLKDRFTILHNGNVYSVDVLEPNGKTRQYKTAYRFKRTADGLTPEEFEDLIVKGGLEDIRNESKPAVFQIKDGQYAHTLVDVNVSPEDLVNIEKVIKDDIETLVVIDMFQDFDYIALDYVNVFQIIIDLPLND